MKQSKFNSIAIVAVFALVVCLALPTAAQAAPVIPWFGGDGNFSDVYHGGGGPDPQGWDYPSKPNSGLLGYVTTGATVTVDQFGEVAWVATLGTDPYCNISGEGHLAIGTGSFSTAQLTVGCGPDSTGTITQTGGSVTVCSKSGLSLGNQDGNATYTISGGSLSLRATNHDMFVGRNGTGKFNIIGDDASILLGILVISEQNGASGTLDLDIDAGGISPIQIVSGGHVHINNGTTATRTLDISLIGLAPETDLVLIDNLGAGNPVMGIFDGLPEGAPIQASFDGQTYNWNISYAYGANSNDVALVFDSVGPDVGCFGCPDGDFNASNLVGLEDLNLVLFKWAIHFPLAGTRCSMEGCWTTNEDILWAARITHVRCRNSTSGSRQRPPVWSTSSGFGGRMGFDARSAGESLHGERPEASPAARRASVRPHQRPERSLKALAASRFGHGSRRCGT